MSAPGIQGQATPTPTWKPLGPTAVQTSSFGLVTGRISAIALDPADTTGNHVYVGTTGGGVWEAENAAVSTPSLIAFTPLTETLEALGGAPDASISIGALTVQPGGTGVILAGTGDPNDALDSYYGAGILRSGDGGNTWTLVQETSDLEQGLGAADVSFVGEGVAGFAWSTVNPQVVVAAVSQAYEGTLVNATELGTSCQGLYYSADGGLTWHLATISDGTGNDVQGPKDLFPSPDGNAATAVVWNPVRQLFVAAVRYHGYYQSADGVTWTRMAAQPGSGLSAVNCPTNPGGIGSIDCPIFRGALAVNPQSGDTFAWTTDIYDQDQGLWQDSCAINLSGACGNQTISFGRQWSTTALETNSTSGSATILNGDYNLVLAAVPNQQDTTLLAGANDLWKCSLAMGCAWRNTTNTNTCMSAQVGEFQHALAWNAADSQEVFVGNDSGLWRSTDQIGESGQACSASDSTHFQNLNGSLGSLAEVTDMAEAGGTPYTMMAALGVNGTAGVTGTTGPTTDWPQILSGDGGAVAIDPTNNSNWYVNNEPGVSIHLCSQSPGCTPADFNAGPSVTDADVGGDGYTMTTPAPFLVDPLDASQLLVGTCRLWRGPASGAGWGASNAVSPVLDSGATGVSCNGDTLIRTMAATVLGGGSEVVYVGMYGALDGGVNLAGHVLSAVIDPSSSTMPVWQDLTLNPVVNAVQSLNHFGMDISSIFIDPHDPTGKTVYVTVEGMSSQAEPVRVIYRSTDGGAHWYDLTANLPAAPANSVAVDPQSASTVYVATDVGVYLTTEVSACATITSNCWSAFGTGLPSTPAVGLMVPAATAADQVLVAATYGRGIWQTPLWTSGVNLTAASVDPVSLAFGNQVFGTTSGAQTVTLNNTGSVALTPTGITMSGDFNETDNCQSKTIAAGGSCAIQVTFTPTATGSRVGGMTVSANVYGGQLTVDLSGTGTPAGNVTLSPSSVDFGQVETGVTSTPLQVVAGNAGNAAIPISGVAITGPFIISSNSCGTTSLAAQTDCQLMIEFAPTQAGAAAGTLTLTDGAGVQTVALSGVGAAPPTDGLNPSSVSFPGTAVGQLSAAQNVQLTNTGDLPLESIAVSASAGFQTSNNCTTQLTAHAACSISVVFAPAQVGAQTGTLTVSDALHTQTVPLSGTGLQPPAIGLSPSSLTFAAQQPGIASQLQALTVTNTGGAPMANVGFQISGSGASSFSTGTTTCGATLNSGASCTVQVGFESSGAGGSAAMLTVSSSTLGVTPASVPLSGTAQVSSGLNVNPTQLTFAAVNVGQTTAAQTVTVSNTSTYTFNSLTVAASGPFVLTQNSCSGALAAGASCTAAVAFQPTSSAAATGALTVSSAAVPAPSSVALIGSGGVQVTPATISFPVTGAGTTSSATTITITNLGAASALTGLALTVPAGFQLTANTCASTLPAQASCTAGVEFAPTSAGQQSGSLTVTTNTVQAAPVALSGMGFDFNAAATGSASQTVASGQTAKYTIAISTLNGSQGSFSFQCPTLPALAVCAFSPATETVTASAEGNVSVGIATGQAGTAWNTGGEGPWHAVPLVCGVFLLPALWKRRKVLTLAVLLVILAGGVSSCTGSGGGGSGSGGSGASGSSTPAGTYTVPVTVSSTGVQHTVTLTLTVD